MSAIQHTRSYLVAFEEELANSHNSVTLKPPWRLAVRGRSGSRWIARFRSFLTLVLSSLFDALLWRVDDRAAYSQD